MLLQWEGNNMRFFWKEYNSTIHSWKKMLHLWLLKYQHSFKIFLSFTLLFLLPISSTEDTFGTNFWNWVFVGLPRFQVTWESYQNNSIIIARCPNLVLHVYIIWRTYLDLFWRTDQIVWVQGDLKYVYIKRLFAYTSIEEF